MACFKRLLYNYLVLRIHRKLSHFHSRRSKMVSGLSRHLYVIKTKFRNEQVKERALQQVLAHNTAAIGVDEQWCR